MRLKTLTYTSRARLDLRDEELSAIHQSARHLNALDGISGLLIFDGSRFLQIVEGAEDAIDNLVGRLRMDPRHSAFEVRDERHVERRSFPDWTMELVRVSAGYGNAKEEIATVLPSAVAAPVRELVIKMSGEMAAASCSPAKAGVQPHVPNAGVPAFAGKQLSPGSTPPSGPGANSLPGSTA